MIYSIEQYDVNVWSERDRAQLTLLDKNGKEIFTLWDSEVHSAVEDGFIDPNYLVESCVQYAVMRGLI